MSYRIIDHFFVTHSSKVTQSILDLSMLPPLWQSSTDSPLVVDNKVYQIDYAIYAWMRLDKQNSLPYNGPLSGVSNT